VTGLVEQAKAWLAQGAEWAVPVLFAITFVESLPGVSLLVPSTTLLLATGALIGAGTLEPGPVSPPPLQARSSAMLSGSGSPVPMGRGSSGAGCRGASGAADAAGTGCLFRRCWAGRRCSSVRWSSARFAPSHVDGGVARDAGMDGPGAT
jgi:hypothetical protein